MSDVEIRQAELGDLPLLPPALGQQEFFADRFARQEKGDGSLLIAWDGGRPVGVIYLWLEPAEEPEIRTYLGGVPILTHIEVLRGKRGRGIGTALTHDAEQRVRARGSDRIALAVSIEKYAPVRRYIPPGYRDWGHGLVTCLTEEWLPDGSRIREPELCHVLVKRLAEID